MSRQKIKQKQGQNLPKFGSPQFQEEQLNQILLTTVITDCNYTDNQIQYLINPIRKLSIQKKQLSQGRGSVESQFSMIAQSLQSRNSLLRKNNEYQCQQQFQKSKLKSRRTSFQMLQDEQEIQQNNQNPLTQYSNNKNRKKCNNFKQLNQINNQDDLIYIQFLKQLNLSHQVSTFDSQKQFIERSSNAKSIIQIKQNLPYRQIYEQIQSLQTPLQLEKVQKLYPLFISFKPSYKIQQTHEKNKINLIQFLIDKQIRNFDVAFQRTKNNQSNFSIAIGTNKNIVAIFQTYFERPVQLIQAFNSNTIHILSVKWSQSTQYLLVSNNNKELKLFQIKQYSKNQFLQQQLIFLKVPLQIFYLQSPKFKTNIVKSYFLFQTPLKILLVDQEYQIYLIEMKKHFISLRPHINKLPVKFNQFNNIKVQKIKDSQNNNGFLLAISNSDYVTIAVIQPKFQVILVYDKEKHFQNVQESEQSLLNLHKDSCQIDFLNDSENNQFRQIRLLIAWKNFIQILKIKIFKLSPLLEYKIQTQLKYKFQESSLLVGGISQTIIYQITKQRMINIFSLNQLSKYYLGFFKNSNIQNNQNKSLNYANYIYSTPFILQNIPFYNKIIKTQHQQNLKKLELQFMKNFICTCNHNLFICYQKTIQRINIKSFPKFVQNIIQNINDWKIGLQLLNDALSKKLTCFDNIKNNKIKNQLKQYSLRYIQFINGIMKNSNLQDDSVWAHQIYSLFNILLQANQQKFLMKQVIIKLYRIKKVFLKFLQPFILMNKINWIEQQTLQLLFQNIDLKIVRRIIYSIRQCKKNENNQVLSNQIPHVINRIMIKYKMQLELIWINQYFDDYYTPIVILASQIQLLKDKMLNIKQQQSQKSSYQQIQIVRLSKLLSFLLYDIFLKINISNYNKRFAYEQQFYIAKQKAKQILQTLIPLIQLKLNNILIQYQPNEYFDYLFEQLCKGNCLDTLVQIQNQNQNQIIIKKLIQSIQVVKIKDKQCMRKYWFLILRLIMRKLLKTQVIKGLQYLIFQNQNKSKITVNLINIFVKTCYEDLNNEIQKLQKFKIQQLFDKIINLHQSKYQNNSSVNNFYKKYIQQIIQSNQYFSIQLLKLFGKYLQRQVNVIQCMILCEQTHNVILFIYYTINLQIDLLNYIQEVIKQQISLSLSEFQKKYINKQKSLQKSLKSITHISNSSSKLQKIKQILKQNIKLLTQIDAQKLSYLIIYYFKSEMKQFIQFLNSNPKQQMNLLKQILSYYNYGEFLNKQKLIYLQLLARMGYDQKIIYQIQNYMFPLDQSINICKKYQITQAYAYLLIKSGGQGNASKAIEIYFTLIRKKIQEYKYNRKTHQRYIELNNVMCQYLQKCIKICIDLDLKGNSLYQTQWFYIIQQLQDLKKWIYRTSSHQIQSSLKIIINQTLYGKLINQLLDQVTQYNLVDYIQKSIHSLELQTLKLMIVQMSKSYYYQKQILKNSQGEISKWEIQIRKQVFNQICNGVKSNSRCYECQRKDAQIKIHYSCGHDIHPTCNHDIKQCISCKNQLDFILKKQIDIKDKTDKSGYFYHNIIDQNQKLGFKQITRLTRQEKLKQFDQIQIINQEQFQNDQLRFQ